MMVDSHHDCFRSPLSTHFVVLSLVVLFVALYQFETFSYIVNCILLVLLLLTSTDKTDRKVPRNLNDNVLVSATSTTPAVSTTINNIIIFRDKKNSDTTTITDPSEVKEGIAPETSDLPQVQSLASNTVINNIIVSIENIEQKTLSAPSTELPTADVLHYVLPDENPSAVLDSSCIQPAASNMIINNVIISDQEIQSVAPAPDDTPSSADISSVAVQSPTVQEASSGLLSTPYVQLPSSNMVINSIFVSVDNKEQQIQKPTRFEHGNGASLSDLPRSDVHSIALQEEPTLAAVSAPYTQPSESNVVINNVFISTGKSNNQLQSPASLCTDHAMPIVLPFKDAQSVPMQEETRELDLTRGQSATSNLTINNIFISIENSGKQKVSAPLENDTLPNNSSLAVQSVSLQEISPDELPTTNMQSATSSVVINNVFVSVDSLENLTALPSCSVSRRLTFFKRPRKKARIARQKVHSSALIETTFRKLSLSNISIRSDMPCLLLVWDKLHELHANSDDVVTSENQTQSPTTSTPDEEPLSSLPTITAKSVVRIRDELLFTVPPELIDNTDDSSSTYKFSDESKSINESVDTVPKLPSTSTAISTIFDMISLTSHDTSVHIPSAEQQLSFCDHEFSTSSGGIVNSNHISIKDDSQETEDSSYVGMVNSVMVEKENIIVTNTITISAGRNRSEKVDSKVKDTISTTKSPLTTASKKQTVNHQWVLSCKKTPSLKGLTCDNDGNVIVCDSENHCLHIISDKGTFVKSIYKIKNPYDIAIDKHGNIIVACLFAKAFIISKEYKMIHSFNTDIKFSHGVDVSKDENFIISDTQNNCIKIFNMGGLVRKFGLSGSRNEQFKDPKGLVIDKEGRLYVCDSGNKRIQVFTADGNFERTIEIPTRPRYIDIDDNGDLYAIGTEEVKILTSKGELIKDIPCGVFTHGIAVSPSGNIILSEKNKLSFLHGMDTKVICLMKKGDEAELEKLDVPTELVDVVNNIFITGLSK
jgi:sugar lactone lactonase YvrE